MSDPTPLRHPPLTLAFDSPEADLATAGGKGAALSRLARAGVDVPGGFHVTTAAYRRFVAQAGIAETLAEAVAGAAPEHPPTLDRAAARALELFLAAPVPEDVAKAVRTAYTQLTAEGPGPADAKGRGAQGSPAVAVRSSATAEDLPDLSFAGQQETYLNIRGEQDLLDAVRRCWASLWTARAIGYRALHGVPSDGIALAVVVQRLVDADAAGVLFTRDPVTGDPERIVVNASWGLGEAVVSGLVTPDTVVVDRARRTVAAERLGAKEVMTVRGTTGTREVPVPGDRRGLPVLGPGEAADLAEVGVRIEELYGVAVDVEWARSVGRLQVLQARPVTVGPAPAVEGREAEQGEQPAAEREVWNDSLRADQLWTSTNVGEALPSVITPATWSLTRRWLGLGLPASGVPDVPVHANIGGRWYVNYSVSVAFGNRGPVAQVFGAVPEDVTVPPPRPARPVLLWRLARHVIGVLPGHLPYLRETAARVRRVPGLCADVRRRIDAAGTPEALAVVWREHVDPMIEHVGRLAWASARAGGYRTVALRPWLARRGVSEADANALSNASGTSTATGTGAPCPWPASGRSWASVGWRAGRSTGTPTSGSGVTAVRTSSRCPNPARPRTRPGSTGRSRGCAGWT